MRVWTRAYYAILTLALGIPCAMGQTKVHLAEERGRPVVLIFGSYTCPPFRDEVPALNRIYRAYKDKVAST